jgi:hypothetical protein
MAKSKEQLEHEARQFYERQQARGPSAIPVGACIVRPGSKGVIGIKAVPVAPDPEKKA